MVCVRKKLKSNKKLNEKHNMLVVSKELERKNEARGITLIALVITIIVLLILAAVSIATLTGDNGILTKAQNAKEKNDEAEKEETAKLAQAEANMNFEETEYNGVTIPAGMAPTRKEGESTVDEGLVAVDKNGNEWVWIEVPKIIYTNSEYNGGTAPSGETDYDEITKVLKAYADPYTKGSAKQIEDPDYNNWTDEWYVDIGTGSTHNVVTEETVTEERQKELDTGCGLTLNQYKETYQKMIKSVYKNGGFWIGRYEAGIEGSTEIDATSLALGRTEDRKGDISKNAICQKDAIPYNYVTCSQAETLAKELLPDSSKTSSLLFGIQWYLVCKFLEVKSDLNETDINTNSNKWGNYYNVEIPIESSNAKSAYLYYNNSDEKYYFSNEWTKMTEATKQAITDKTVENCILLSTGASEKTKILNIYDFAGNEFEYTLEHATPNTSHPCSIGGGSFVNASSSNPASSRNYSTIYANSYYSFRPALY